MRSFMSLAAGLAATLMLGGAAQAATYDLNFGQPLTDGITYATSTVNTGPGMNSDYFNFSVVDSQTEFTTGAFTESAPFAITNADLSLYSGVAPMSGGVSGTALATTGAFDPQSGPIPTFKYDLAAGSYYIKADTTVPSGSLGSYTVTATLLPAVSAAPEPGAWALMLLGLGGVGMALRRQRALSALA